MFRSNNLVLDCNHISTFSHFQTHFFYFSENNHDDPIFFLIKMIADILVYTISKSGTFFNFENFLIVYFLLN